MDIHLLDRGYVNMPNLVYKSLDVVTLNFSTITNFVIDMTLAHGWSRSIVRIFGLNRANCDTSTKVGM